MFEVGDFIWLARGATYAGRIPDWEEDWGIVFKVKAKTKNKYHIYWLSDELTVEDEDWAHKNCQLAASANSNV